MTAIRWVLGKLILLLSALLSPKGLKRSQDQQQEVDNKAKNHTLYQFEACPFCVKVRRAMKRQSVSFALKDAKNNPAHRAELAQGGGRVKVPCLRIDHADRVEWMYESSDIVAYLEKQFA